MTKEIGTQTVKSLENYIIKADKLERENLDLKYKIQQLEVENLLKCEENLMQRGEILRGIEERMSMQKQIAELLQDD